MIKTPSSIEKPNKFSLYHESVSGTLYLGTFWIYAAEHNLLDTDIEELVSFD